MTSALNTLACLGCGIELPTDMSKGKPAWVIAQRLQSCVPCHEEKVRKARETTTEKAVSAPKPALVSVPTGDQVVKQAGAATGAATGEDMSTDANQATVFARDVLIGKFCRTTGLGWLAWNGKMWQPVDGGAVVEAMRKYVIGRYTQAVGDKHEQQIWHKSQSANHIRAVASLAGNVEGVMRDAADFDTDPDLLNTPNGVLDLRTLALMPHDPELMMTKITEVNYRPGVRDDAFDMILESIPDGCHDWLRGRLGQAITGHTPDDERMLMMSGGGDNGKTTLMDSCYRALGGGSKGTGYAALVPNALLLAEKTRGAATPEKMTIRGVRMAYIEETPEGRHLDVQAVKELVGTPTIAGRHLYKDFVTFGATHSLILNTNFPPRVTETDHATWRRLVQLYFPYKFVAPGAPLEKPTDRHGDPTLKTRLKTRSATEAALAWLVEGAHAWYENGCRLPRAHEDPEAVKVATLEWRHESDIILRFIDECAVFDRDAWVPRTAFYDRFKEWARTQGHKDMPSNLLASRLKAHTALPKTVGLEIVESSRPGLSGDWLVTDRPTGRQSKAIVGLRWKTDGD